MRRQAGDPSPPSLERPAAVGRVLCRLDVKVALSEITEDVVDAGEGKRSSAGAPGGDIAQPVPMTVDGSAGRPVSGRSRTRRAGCSPSGVPGGHAPEGPTRRGAAPAGRPATPEGMAYRVAPRERRVRGPGRRRGRRPGRALSDAGRRYTRWRRGPGRPASGCPGRRTATRRETGRATHPGDKSTGQDPLPAGSRIATHSTWCVIGKMSD